MQHAHPETERNAAYSATKALGSPITKDATNAAKLTLEQVESLVNWARWHHCSTFEDKSGNEFPLQAILDIWHASIVYETFDCWHEEEPKEARKAYVAICRKHGIKHGA